MNIGTRALLLLIILPATLSACSHFGTPSPYISIKPVIQFVPEKMSPKWNELTREIVPERINRKARAQLVGYENVTNPMYRLVLFFVSTDREVMGASSRSRGGGLVGPLGAGGIGVGVGGSESKINSMYTLEAEAILFDMNNRAVCKWSGYGEDKDAGSAIKKISDKIGEELSKCGVLNPSQYLNPQ